jgi:hypothetical protein
LGYFQLAEYMGLLCLPSHSFPPQLSQPFSWNRLGLAITWWGVGKLLTRLPVPQSGPQVLISAFRQDSLTVSVQCIPCEMANLRIRLHNMYSITVNLYKNQVMLFFFA